MFWTLAFTALVLAFTLWYLWTGSLMTMWKQLDKRRDVCCEGEGCSYCRERIN